MGAETSRPLEAATPSTPLASKTSRAQNSLWWAVTSDIDGSVETILKGIDKEVDRKELINMHRELSQADIEKIAPRPGDEMIGDYSLLHVAICRGHQNDAKYLINHPKMKLHKPYGSEVRTPLHEAVARQNHQIVWEILKSTFVSPSQYINVGDVHGNTPLHQIALYYSDEKEARDVDSKEAAENSSNLKNMKALLRHSPNIDALNNEFWTPLHLLSNYSRDLKTEVHACIHELLNNGAEVNSKNGYGDSPLHEACRKRDYDLIQILLKFGADSDSRNLDWKTPSDLFGDHTSLSTSDQHFVIENFSKIKRAGKPRERAGNIPSHPTPCPDDARKISDEFPIYFRYQWSGKKSELEKDNTSMSWVRTDLKVSQVLYPVPDNGAFMEEIGGGEQFLANSKTKFADRIWKELSDAEKDDVFRKRGEQRPQSGGDEMGKDLVEGILNKHSWRWINFPANNMTWIKDFTIHNSKFRDLVEVDRRVWKFLESNIRIRETNVLHSRVRIPHAYATKGNSNIADSASEFEQQDDDKDNLPKEAPSWTNKDWFARHERLLSVVIPFIDIEMEDEDEPAEGHAATQCQRIRKLNQAYLPFTGISGVQRPQTLDQTSHSAEEESHDFGKGEHMQQVVYRWAEKRRKKREEDEKQRERKTNDQKQRRLQGSQKQKASPQTDEWRQEKAEGFGTRVLRPFTNTELAKRLWALFRTPTSSEKESKDFTRPKKANKRKHSHHDVVDQIPQERVGRRGGSAPQLSRIRQDSSPRWLMVRQLWLWKLDDNTILTAIPSRRNGMTADTLLETIRQGNFDTLETPEDVVKRIIFETVKFPDEFKWAGLGEHILDIFQSEIAFETDQETKFFENFKNAEWTAKVVDKNVEAAAKSTWLVKDIRDELRLLRQVFETQQKVVEDFADYFWPGRTAIPAPGEIHYKDSKKPYRDAFLRDCGLAALIDRVKQMDEDASTTLQGLSNIIQATQAQASLKEAESARVMNIIILPFTIVTVIFTPLSFLTSLFAVNTLGFPHNEEGELRLPASWFGWRMTIGELASLVPLVLLVLVLYFRNSKGAAPR